MFFKKDVVKFGQILTITSGRLMPASIYTLPSCSSFFFAELVFEANVTSQNGI